MLSHINGEKVKRRRDGTFSAYRVRLPAAFRFESIYKNPDDKIERLKEFNAVLSPDFSMYTEMPVALQLYNCFRNRWVGAYLQQNGITVIPTVRWGNLESFNFCFDGIEKRLCRCGFNARRKE